MALTKIKTAAIADDAVTTDKLADAINTERTANTAKDLTALSASNLTSGTIPDARFPATLPTASAANLTAVPAANITGTLPAISAANLTSIPAANITGTLPAISATNLTNIPAANITGTLPAISGANLTNLPASGVPRNLIDNGSMEIAQRGTSSTDTSSVKTVDRMIVFHQGANESPTQSQIDLNSTDTGPYELGLRKAFRITNGNQTNADAGDYVWIRHIVESQDLAKSGWNYTSTSSYMTLSFWVRSSVAQDFKGYLRTRDGTKQGYPFSTGSLSANTWTKVTKVLPGASGIQFDNNNEAGLDINIAPWFGTNYSDAGVTEHAWTTYVSGQRTAPSTSTWWLTNDATWDITGIQLELGSTASDFALESYADTLRRCQRYYWKIAQNTFRRVNGYKRGDSQSYWELQCPVPMRTAPSPTLLASGTFTDFQSNFNTTQSGPNVNEWNQDTGWGLLYVSSNWSGSHDSIHSWEGYSIEFSADL